MGTFIDWTVLFQLTSSKGKETPKWWISSMPLSVWRLFVFILLKLVKKREFFFSTKKRKIQNADRMYITLSWNSRSMKKIICHSAKILPTRRFSRSAKSDFWLVHRTRRSTQKLSNHLDLRHFFHVFFNSYSKRQIAATNFTEWQKEAALRKFMLHLPNTERKMKNFTHLIRYSCIIAAMESKFIWLKISPCIYDRQHFHQLSSVIRASMVRFDRISTRVLVWW